MLQSLVQQFGIDSRFCKYGIEGHGEFLPTVDATPLPEVEHHNQQVEDALAFLLQQRSSFAILDKGRSPEERSCIWVEKGHFYGMGYFPSDIGFAEPSELKEFVTPYKSNYYSLQLILSYAEKYSSKVYFREML